MAAALPVLHVCHLEHGGPPFHACRRATDALDAVGVEHERRVSGPQPGRSAC